MNTVTPPVGGWRYQGAGVHFVLRRDVKSRKNAQEDLNVSDSLGQSVSKAAALWLFLVCRAQ